MKPRRSRSALIAGTVVAALLLAGATTLLLCEHFEAVGRAPEEKAKLEALEEAVQTDAAQAERLTEEYERQRDATLARRTHYSIYAALIIVATILLLIFGKILVPGHRESAPTLPQIRRHRGDVPGSGKRKRRRRRRGAAVELATAPEIDLAFVDAVVGDEGRSTETAIAILQRIQKHFRYLPDEALKRVCELTDITPAQIAGVSSFYSQFRRSPVGRYVIKVCHGTACHVSGARELTEEVRRHLKIAPDADTDAERRFTLDEVACVGCCSLAPVMVVEDDTLGLLSPASASAAVDEYWETHE